MIKVKTLLQPVRSIALIGQLRISIVVSADNSEISMLASWLSITCRYCNCFTPLRGDARKLRRVAACGFALECSDYRQAVYVFG